MTPTMTTDIGTGKMGGKTVMVKIGIIITMMTGGMTKDDIPGTGAMMRMTTSMTETETETETEEADTETGGNEERGSGRAGGTRRTGARGGAR